MSKERTPNQRAARPYWPLLQLARGGMGTVMLALRREGTFRRIVALKRPLPAVVDDPAARAMFMDEARLAGLIRHPHVVAVLDFGEDEDGPFMAMEYVEGVSLATLLEILASRSEVLPLGLALLIGAQCARGLHAAHELTDAEGAPLGLVHRDVSPRNILMGVDGLVRLTDFGVAKAQGNLGQTMVGVIKGNVGYLPPEALRFESVDRRADLFGLGVVLFELFTGTRLYGDTSVDVVARRILHEGPPDLWELRPDAPGEVVELLLELLAKQPDQRPATAQIVADRLSALLADMRLELEGGDLGAFVRDRCAEVLAERSREVTRLVTQTDAVRVQAVRGFRWRVALLGVLALGVVGFQLYQSFRPGLQGEYFSGTVLTDVRLSRIDPEIHFDWGASGQVAPGLRSEAFSVRWTGRVRPPTTGPRDLCVLSDDGHRLWVDGKLVQDDWLGHAARLTCTPLVLNATAGHTVRIEYLQTVREAVIHFLWRASGDLNPPTVIPSSALRQR